MNNIESAGNLLRESGEVKLGRLKKKIPIMEKGRIFYIPVGSIVKIGGYIFSKKKIPTYIILGYQNLIFFTSLFDAVVEIEESHTAQTI